MACDPNFYALLILDGAIKRPTTASTKNQYGEVILDQSAPVLYNIKTRLDPSPGKEGLSMEFQGRTVFAEFKAFICPDVDIIPNDILEVNSRTYLVLRVDPFYDGDDLHHLEVMLKRTDVL